MIKKLLSLFVPMLLSLGINAQNFSLYYDFSSVTNGSASTGAIDPTPVSPVTGVTSGSWTTVGTGTNPSGSTYFSFSNWPTGATNGNNTTFTGSIDPSKYYELTLTTQPNYMITLTNMSFGTSRSSTGARNWAVRTNKSNFNNNVAATYTALNAAASQTSPVITIQSGDTFFWTDDANTTSSGAPAYALNNICNVNFSGPNYTDQAGTYIIRIYAWNAEGTSGTFRIDTTVINGIATFSVGAGLTKITHDLNASFKLYPNPSNNGVVYLESTVSKNATIEVVNILGTIVAKEVKDNSVSKIKLNLSQLAGGTYFVRSISNGAVRTEKLVISN